MRPADLPGVSLRAGGGDAEVLWSPPAGVLDSTRIGAYMRWLKATRGIDFTTYQELWEWSVRDLPGFWSSIWEHFGIHSESPYEAVLAQSKMPGAVWFPGAKINYAEHALRRRGGEVAVASYSQTRPPVTLSWDELAEQVGAARAGLVRLGVEQGDRVGAYLPNIAETVVAMLATASLGAIWSSCASEFGTRSVIDRLGQIRPKVLIAADGYRYGERDIERAEQLSAIRDALPALETTVVVPYLHPERVPEGEGIIAWSELLSEPVAASFEPVPFDHPLYVLYSSGTTGLPKAIVHCQGGILIEHLKVLALHHDLGEADRFFWFSTTGWMMWNYLVSGLLVGAGIVCFDGNPAYPDLSALWRLAEEAGMTYFGTSAPFLMSCRKAGLEPGRSFDLSALRGVGSTGSPLPPEGFRWVYEAVGANLQLSSVSGGTDVCTAFVGAVPLIPVRAGEISCRCLGVAVDAYGPQGEVKVAGPRR